MESGGYIKSCVEKGGHRDPPLRATRMSCYVRNLLVAMCHSGLDPE
jgi:hypothetical protein